MAGYTKQERPYWNQFRNFIQTVYNENSAGHDRYSHLGTHWTGKDYYSFERYIKRYLGDQPTPYHKLARKDQRRGWYPGNLAWMTGKEVSNIMIDNCRWITYNKKTQSLMAWSEELGISYWTLYNRLNKGWPLKKAFVNKQYNKWE